jgi:hypothetical protein
MGSVDVMRDSPLVLTEEPKANPGKIKAKQSIVKENGYDATERTIETNARF